MQKQKNKKILKAKSYKLKASKGFGMVEIMVMVSIIMVAFTAILQLFRLQVVSERSKREELRAHVLLAEALEAVRAVRDESWANISSNIGGDHYVAVAVSGVSRWVIQNPDPGPIDGYTRWIVLTNARRDLNDDIVPSGGTIDSDTAKVNAYVEWQSGGDTKTRMLTTYITNWQEKL